MKTRIPLMDHLARTLLVFGAVLLMSTGAWAYDDYSGTGTQNCWACHGNFRANPYFSLSDQQSWGNDLHDIHRRDMVESDCTTCHSNTGFSPVIIHDSGGGTGLPSIGCLGCHGVDPDGAGPEDPTGTGLRQHHFRAGQTVCLDCHPDADPASGAPPGENVKPPYYAAGPGTDPAHPDMPYDPCNPGATFNEDFAGLTTGLDNDGDLIYDDLDGDCPNAAGLTAGETAGPATPDLLRVGKDPVLASTLNLSYGPICRVSTNRIEFGDIGGLGFPLTYAGQECDIGSSGFFDWNYAAATNIPDSFFFLVVGNDAAIEGSYGTDDTGAERNPDVTSTTCTPLPQNLVNRCD